MPDRTKPLNELLSLAGKTAIVTGGAAGIGAAIAYRLAEAGAKIIIADKDGQMAGKTAGELTGYGYKSLSITCDVSNEPEVTAMINSAVSKMGGVDILVNNAGIFPNIPTLEMTGEEFDRVMAVNLKGALLCSREASRRMIQQNRGGCIINIASIAGLHPSTRGFAAYDSSKGGMLALTRSLALELGEHGIRVNAIAPGGIITGGFTSQASSLRGKEYNTLKQFMLRAPLGRMGRPDEIACVALFLASELASYITGSVITADGGYLLS